MPRNSMGAFGRARVGALIGLAAMAGLVGCGDDDADRLAAGGGDAPNAEAKAFLDTVKAGIRAENAKDAEAFLALWTDNGLEQYDVGTREDVASGKSENFGTDKVEVTEYGTPEIEGDTAIVELQAIVGEHTFATPVHQVTLEGVKRGGRWRLDGFEFMGSPPPPDGATIIDVTAIDYAFQLSEATVSADDPIAFRFRNGGTEQHELTMFKAPDGTEVDAAKADLENVDGSELADIPDGYEAAHVSFVEVGQSQDVTFAANLEAGTYVLACYLPQGGFGPEGPINADGTPHIQLGMINLLTTE